MGPSKVHSAPASEYYKNSVAVYKRDSLSGRPAERMLQLFHLSPSGFPNLGEPHLDRLGRQGVLS